jgi:hypothetical protein
MKIIRNKLKFFTYLLALFVLLVAGEIEHLNIQAGGLLPNQEYRNNDPEQGVVKWRDSPCANERGWRMSCSPSYGIPEDRPLTPAEEAQMRQDIDKAWAGISLRGFVASFGLLQYLLVPLLLVLSIKMILRKPYSVKRYVIGTFSLLIGIGAGILMFSRAYFTSLGW